MNSFSCSAGATSTQTENKRKKELNELESANCVTCVTSESGAYSLMQSTSKSKGRMERKGSSAVTGRIMKVCQSFRDGQ